MNAAPGPAPGPQSTSDASPPRAFAQGTGVLLQTAGMLLLLSSCVICAFTGQFDPVASRGQTLEAIRQQQTLEHPLRDLFRTPAQTGYMLTVMFTLVGGLAMAGFGLGLQSDRRRAAVGALITTASLSVILLVAGFELWSGRGPGRAPIVALLWHALLLLGTLLLTGFSWVAWRQVVASPPPANIEVVPPGTKIPYSFYHDDPPEVRLAAELAQRRARLEAEQRDVERLEQELKDKEKKG